MGTPADAQLAMRDALASALQQVLPALGVTDSYAVADRALDQAGYAAITEYIAAVDVVQDVFRTALLTHGPLPPAAANADANLTGPRNILRDAAITGDLILI